jgi:alpha-amylase/alpha-mannosidase (GH57 family)
MTHNRYLAIHGHFYQPPRENPWTEEIELQKSAAPFHDWNERIHHECYLPNARARVLEEDGRIVDIVNNFEMMSFNFGPTLLSWLERKHPDTYRAIVLADQASVRARGGHGNAIAQVYNHMVMPLASRRDKVTQVRWGVEDFRHRFGREPESIWLPETAANEETLEVLVEEGFKFVILGPSQAEAVRPLGEARNRPGDGDWRDVSHGQIDPKRPYRTFLKDRPDRFIDVFFYDGPVSKAIGFEDLLFSSARFAERLASAADPRDSGDQLVAAATDGETYGHHKPFGDRVFAYLAMVEAGRRGFRVVNFAEYLAAHPPAHEVRLKAGEGGEGTSWSCPHGVRRWKDHCGCRGGGPSHWAQHWRRPLREALDRLRDELGRIFETRGREFFQDPWDARDGYIRVVLDRSEESIARFMDRHSKKPLAREELTLALKLLEMQRQAMLMYTSCGWFFTDLSGIETVQILQYAARALELAEEISGLSLEEDFVRGLAHAKSNFAELRDGRGVWERFVRPSRTSPAKIAAHYAILSIFDTPIRPAASGAELAEAPAVSREGGSAERGDRFRMYCWSLEVLHQRRESYANLTMNFGRVRMVSRVTLEEHDLAFIVLQFGTYDFRCSVKPMAETAGFEKIERDLFDELHSGHVVELLRKIDFAFGHAYYDLKDLFLAERQGILATLSREAIEKISAIHEELYDQSRRMNEIYSAIHLPIPEEIRYAATLTLSRRLAAEVNRLAGVGFHVQKAASLYKIIEVARKFGVDLKRDEVAAFLSAELKRRTSALLDAVRPDLIAEALNIDRIARKIGVDFDLRAPQDDLFELLKRWRGDPAGVRALAPELVDDVFRLAAAIGMSPKEYMKNLEKAPS